MYSKKTLFTAIFALTFIFFACSDDPNSPPTLPPDCDPLVETCELSSSSDPVEFSSSSDESGCDPLLTDCQPQSSSSGEPTESSSSSENPVSSSSTQVDVTCDNVSTLFCGGATVTNGSQNAIPATGACVFIEDFSKIQPNLNSTVSINGVENTCGSEWGEFEGGCMFNTKPAPQNGGYYVYVKSGGLNAFAPEGQDYPNGWQGVVAGNSTCTSQNPSSSSVAIVPSSSSVTTVPSSSSITTAPSSSSITTVPSSSSVTVNSCNDIKTGFCGGADIYNGSPNAIPTTGTCVFIEDFEQIEPAENSTVSINGTKRTCTTGWEADGSGDCGPVAKPSKVNGGYYVYVQSGNINAYTPDNATEANGWKGVVAGNSNCAVQNPKENFHIYLAFGQSNMEGACPPAPNNTIPDSYKNVDSRFQVMAAVSGNYGGIQRTKGQWYTAVPPLVQPGACLNPADYFGRTIVANTPSNIKVGVIVAAVGGAAIEGFTKTEGPNYYRGEGGWMQGMAEKYDLDPYKTIVDLAKEAQKTGTIKGIIMHQGESGAKEYFEWARKVNTIYNNMLSDLGLPANSIPFIAGEPMNVNKQLVTNLPNTFTATMPNGEKVCHIAKSEGLVIFDDYHFTFESYKTLGERYGNIMLDLLYR